MKFDLQLLAAARQGKRACPGSSLRTSMFNQRLDKMGVSSRNMPFCSNHMHSNTWLIIGILFASAAVAIGAFGAHGLKDTLAATGRAENFETGVRYHMYHALALIAVAIWAQRFPAGGQLFWLGLCFAAGIVLFSGSLYILAVTNVTKWGMVTPIGGVLFLVGWGLWAWKAMRSE
jgi:uncharacterized membrane protein YgdD (TMEM256/DUF423 family)